MLVGGGLYKRNDEEGQLCDTKINWALNSAKRLAEKGPKQTKSQDEGMGTCDLLENLLFKGICEDQ